MILCDNKNITLKLLSIAANTAISIRIMNNYVRQVYFSGPIKRLVTDATKKPIQQHPIKTTKMG